MSSKDEERFEQVYERLQETVRRLEDGSLPLEEAIEAYETGMALVARCRDLLTQAELRVTRLREQLDSDG
ncbi:MAG TPA: exodeoxyribonuclease VII small subunit [Dehalococcoidia bacterium]|nr:exodeoxyribonuclease VII small subunit [Dehalococcoidia bacterium]